MRATHITISMAALAAGAAHAEEFADRVYVRGDVGAGFAGSLDGSGALAGGPAAGGFDGAIDTGAGLAFGLGAGFQISPAWRVEAELRASAADEDGARSIGGVPTRDGEIFAAAAFLNIARDFAPQRPLSPFLGAGIGYGAAEVRFTDAFGDAFSATDSAPAGQIFAGLSWRLSPAATAEVSARLVRLQGLSLEDRGYGETFAAERATLEGDRTEAALGVGLRYRFVE